MSEIWKDIPGYEGYYQVSNLGRVKSKHKNWEEKKPYLAKGYYYHCLYLKGREKKYKLSQIVAMAFLSHKPNGYDIIVDHINNNKTDDRLENLQLITNRLNLSKDRKNKTSKYTGVYYCKHSKKWRSDIRINKKGVYLGKFNTEEEAHQAYINKLKEIQHI